MQTAEVEEVIEIEWGILAAEEGVVAVKDLESFLADELVGHGDGESFVDCVVRVVFLVVVKLDYSRGTDTTKVWNDSPVGHENKFVDLVKTYKFNVKFI